MMHPQGCIFYGLLRENKKILIAVSIISFVMLSYRQEQLVYKEVVL